MKEKLSALIDDELDDLDERRVLNALGADAELRRAWGRYHLIRAAMTRQLSALAAPDLPERIMARLQESDAAVPYPSLRFWPLAGGFAVAASVAAIAILGIQALRGPVLPGTASALAVAPSAINEVASAAVPASSSEPTNSDDRLSLYVVGHNEFMPTAGMGSMLPYVRVVAHSADNK